MKAVIFVDVQNDFVKGGALAFGYPVEDNTPKITEFAKQCIADGYKIYATRDTHTTDYMNTLEGKKLPVPHCIEGSDGWMIKSDLLDVILGKATIVNKPTFGSYDLVDIIKEDVAKLGEFDEIILTGYCTSICVMSNSILLRAAFPNTKITIMSDLCGDVSKEAHDAALTVAAMQQIDVK